ncbi:uncharacterized protein LOC122949163 [Acropora millepora]|uniref:uncharacterized protein LOC122949163 n=1 Tax=Acropora millepora TaxID=45264 RepID=UPI001CF3ABCD|nr:uncharacterized protein LOC122949163 [Acropora millepora]
MIRTEVRTFNLSSLESYKQLTPAITLDDDRITTVKFQNKCTIHLGIHRGSPEFVDIPDFKYNFLKSSFLGMFVRSGFANKTKDDKLGPCPLGTFVDSSRADPSCKHCPAGGYYSDSLAFVSASCKRCPDGSFVHLNDAPGKSHFDCKACPTGTDGKSFAGFRACYCQDGFFRRHMFQGCEACAKHNGFKCTNDSFYLKKGYWWKWENETNKELFISFRDALSKNSSVENNSTYMYPYPLPQPHRCPRPESCLGGMDSNCSEGYEGPLCDVCRQGYYKQLKTCGECPSKKWIIGQLCLIAAVIFAITAVVAWRTK